MSSVHATPYITGRKSGISPPSPGVERAGEKDATNADYQRKRLRYQFARPFTKESLLYRELFEKYYPGQAEMVADFWMPNKRWPGRGVDDPSARVLSNYGASGA